MKAAIYTRISRDTEGRGLGVARQEKECRELAKRKGWDVVEVFSDNDISAYSGKRRPGYERLCDAMRQGEIAGLVVYANDRLHRHPRELEDFIDIIEKSGTQIASVTGGEYDLTTPDGLLHARIRGSIARHESDQKSARAKSKHRELAEAGKVAGGGSRPFGFEDDRLTIRDSEALIIRELASRVLAGETLRSLATDLNSRGVLTTTGKEWNTVPLRRMLLSPRIAGLRQFQGEAIGQAEWDGIISEADHLAIRAVFSDPRRKRYNPTTNGRPYLLTGGLGVCSLCGAGLVARPKGKRPGEKVGRRAYVCASGVNFSGCGKIRSLADPVEDLLRDAIATRLAGGDLARAIEDAASDDTERTRAMEALHSQEGKLAQLAEDYAEDRIDRALYLETADRIKAKLADLRTVVTTQATGASLPDLPNTEGGIARRWDSESMGWRRRLTSLLIEQVTVNPAIKGQNFFNPSRVEVAWRV